MTLSLETYPRCGNTALILMREGSKEPIDSPSSSLKVTGESWEGLRFLLNKRDETLF